VDLGENGNWLTFDNSSLLLSGHPTEGDKGTTVTITVQDVFDDIVCSTVQVDLFNGLFATTLPPIVNATVGQEFSFVLNDTFFAVADVQLSVTFKPEDGENWLSYNSESRTISGTPDDSKAKLVQVDIDASSASLSEKQSTSFTVQTIFSSGAPLNPHRSISIPTNYHISPTYRFNIPVLSSTKI
jgi:Putative Ig domain